MPSPCHFHRGKLQHSEGSCRRSFPLKYFPCPVRANEVPPVVPRQDFVLGFSVGWAPRSVTNAINAKRVSCHLGCLPPWHAERTRLHQSYYERVALRARDLEAAKQAFRAAWNRRPKARR